MGSQTYGIVRVKSRESWVQTRYGDFSLTVLHKPLNYNPKPMKTNAYRNLKVRGKSNAQLRVMFTEHLKLTESKIEFLGKLLNNELAAYDSKHMAFCELKTLFRQGIHLATICQVQGAIKSPNFPYSISMLPKEYAESSI